MISIILTSGSLAASAGLALYVRKVLKDIKSVAKSTQDTWVAMYKSMVEVENDCAKMLAESGNHAMDAKSARDGANHASNSAAISSRMAKETHLRVEAHKADVGHAAKEVSKHLEQVAQNTLVARNLAQDAESAAQDAKRHKNTALIAAQKAASKAVGMATCSVCGNGVLRYYVNDSGYVVCANCDPKGFKDAS